MKKIICAILLFAAVLVSAGSLQVSVDRDTVPENEVFYYTIEYSGELDGKIGLPPLENGEWLTNIRRTGMSISNGRRVASLAVGIRGTKVGTLIIPAFPVGIDGKQEETKPIEVKIVPIAEMKVNDSAGSSSRLSDNVFGELTLPGKRQSYYVGEAIPMRITVLALSDLQPRLNQLPELAGTADLAARSYQWPDGRTSNFAEPDIRQTVHNGRRFIRFDFDTVMRPLKPGKVEPRASLSLSVALPDEQRNRPSFGFGFGFPFSDAEYTPYKVELKAPGALEIKSLPAAPSNAVNLGLIGKWTLTGGFDRKDAKAGEALTFSLDLKGDGTVETLDAPKLSFEHMRVFPPEVKKDTPGTIRIQYAVVPLKAGDFRQAFQFATFNPESGTYDVHALALDLPVAPSELPMTRGFSSDETAAAPESASSASAKATPRHVHRTAPGKGVGLPLVGNALPLAAAIAIAAGIIALVIELLARKAHRMQNDPEYRRVLKLKKETPQVIAQLKAAKDDGEFLKLLSGSVQPLLAEALRLPPGATPSEVIEKIDDPALRECLRSGEAAEFMPAAARQKLFSRENVELLISGLRRYAPLLLLGFLLALPGNAAEAAADPFRKGGEAFAAGNYPAAIEAYRKALNDRAPSPHILYNLGEASLRIGDLPAAKGYLERARRLAPLDPVISEDLRQVNSALKLPEYDGGAVGRYRDMLRPDWYLLTAAVALAAFMLFGAVRRKLPPVLVRLTLLAAATVFVLAAAAMYFQMHGTYRPDRAVVLGTTQELRALPASKGSVVAVIPGGGDARIIDRNGEFVRIDASGQDGWLPADRIMPLF